MPRRQRRIRLAAAHPAAFARLYFKGEILVPPHQIAWYNHLLSQPGLGDRDYDKVALFAARDHGKTTTALVYGLWRLARAQLMGQLHRQCWVGYKLDLPQQRLNWIKSTVERRPDIQEDFGLFPDKSRGWSTDGLYFERPKGAPNPPEPNVFFYGIKTGGTGLHMELMIWDDIVTTENSYSDTMRRIILQTIMTSVYPQIVPGGQLFVIATPKNPEDLYSSFADFQLKAPRSRDWRCFFYPAYADDRPAETLLWPQRYTLPALHAKRDSYIQEHGNIGERMYAQEYLLKPHVLGGDQFREEWLRYWNPMDPPVNLRNLLLTIGVDPAVTESSTAEVKATSYCGIAALYHEPSQGRFLVARLIRERVSYGDLPERLARLVRDVTHSHVHVRIGIEAVFWQHSLAAYVERLTGHPIEKINYQRLGIHASKDDRIVMMQPFFSSGSVYLPDPKTDPATSVFVNKEYLPFPNSASKDLLDALHIALRLCPQPTGSTIISW